MIVFDIEATGSMWFPEKYSILSIGAVDFDNPQEQFYEECRMWEGSEFESRALEVNGFSEKDIVDEKRQSEESLVKNYLAWLSTRNDQTMAGQHPFTDVAFLKIAAERYHISYEHRIRTIDVHTLCFVDYLKHGHRAPLIDNVSGLDTDEILRYVGLTGRIGAHNALVDAQLEAEAISRLVFGKGLFDEYAQFGIPDYLIHG